MLVIGAGEVGTAIAEVLDCPVVDVHDRKVADPAVLHICFPWSDRFVEHVSGYQAMYGPDVTVVHSTVPVGTCRRLGAVHSPVRGRHPHLAESVRTFVKFFGGDRAAEAAKPFVAAGVDVRTVDDPETTEAGKLWELLMFGIAVAQQKEMYRWCVARGADPDVAYRLFTETYNDGYRKLGVGHVQRPVIEPMDGPIGGHCVVENAPLVAHPFADLLTDLNGAW